MPLLQSEQQRVKSVVIIIMCSVKSESHWHVQNLPSQVSLLWGYAKNLSRGCLAQLHHHRKNLIKPSFMLCLCLTGSKGAAYESEHIFTGVLIQPQGVLSLSESTLGVW